MKSAPMNLNRCIAVICLLGALVLASPALAKVITAAWSAGGLLFPSGQRCRRPSGHRGNFVMTHEDRLLRSDVDAIARDRAEVEARLRAQRNNPDDMRLWARALQGLTRRPALWHGRIDAAVIEHLAALATDRRDNDQDPDDDQEQLRLEIP